MRARAVTLLTHPDTWESGSPLQVVIWFEFIWAPALSAGVCANDAVGGLRNRAEFIANAHLHTPHAYAHTICFVFLFFVPVWNNCSATLRVWLLVLLQVTSLQPRQTTNYGEKKKKKRKRKREEKKGRKTWNLSVMVWCCYLLCGGGGEHCAFVTVILPIWTTCCKTPWRHQTLLSR